MPLSRTLRRIVDLPPPKGGQFGPDHTVVEVIRPGEWAESDPFILLMDDRLDGKLEAGPHPHAGFETVSYLVHGDIGQESGLGRLGPGDVEWTTAGSGMIHGGSAVGVQGRMRLLQLWLTLPSASRWTTPDHQLIPSSAALVRREPGAEVRLYSGQTGALRSATRNHVPVTLVNLRLDPAASITQALPAAFNGFFYVLSGEATIGDDAQQLRPGQVGWLDRPVVSGDSEIQIANRSEQALEVLLYAGEPQKVELVSYGPFIGETRDDIVRSIERYRGGTFPSY
jgi:redox-sensitive bicupin YhaK (pirin superfamily)